MLHFEFKCLVKTLINFKWTIWGVQMFPGKFCEDWRLRSILKSTCIKCVKVAPGFERLRYSLDDSLHARGIINSLGSAPANNSAQRQQFACVKEPCVTKEYA